MTAGSFCLSTKAQLFCTNINCDLAEDNGVDMSELYELARNGQWTLDRFAELTKLANRDLNGDGVRDQNDQWGFQDQAYVGYAIAIGCGFHIAEKDENDIPYLSAATERNISIVDDLIGMIFADQESYLATENIVGTDSIWGTSGQMWANGQVLIHFNAPNNGWREMEFETAVLPAPKYTEDQESYCHTGSVWNTPMIGVPISVQEPEKVSFILEAMAYESFYSVLPVFYDNYLETKLMRSPEDVEMIRIVQETPYFDIGGVYNWGNLMNSCQDIAQKAYNPLVTATARVMTSAGKTIEKLVQKIEKNEKR